MATIISSEDYSDKYIIINAQNSFCTMRVLTKKNPLIWQLIKVQFKIWIKSFLVMIGLKKSNK